MEIIDAKHAIADMQENITRFRNSLDLEALTEEIADYENRMTEPGFWDDNDKAQKVIEENNVLKNRRDSFLNLTSQVEDLEVLTEMLAEDPEDTDLENELSEGIAKAQQDATVVEYFYLESPHIPEKFFPIKVYGIYDRVTIDDEKLSRIKEDIIKILATTKKFGVYQVLGEKLENDTDLAKAVDKDVFNVAGAIQWYTDKNYDPDSDISYPDFTTQHFSPNRPE